MRIYLDNAATTAVLPEVIEVVTRELMQTGNPSSLHTDGREARKDVEVAREQIAESLGCRAGEVIFTAGGTEANNLAIKGMFWFAREQNPEKRIVIVSAIEHHAVLDPALWLETSGQATVLFAPVDELGKVDVQKLESMILQHKDNIALVSVMWANNEVGTIQPIDEIARLVHAHGILFHTDAVQAIGSLPVRFDALPIDAMTISGHKLGGPMGVGALLLKRELKAIPLLHGGGQEREIRSGTLATHLIAGFGKAIEIAVSKQAEYAQKVSLLRDAFIQGVEHHVEGARLMGDRENRLPGNAHFCFDGAEGDALLMLLDAAGVSCSTGSACTAGIAQPSHVLLAMGLSESEAIGALRFSLGRNSTLDEIRTVVELLPEIVARARRAGKTSVRTS
jgi:cysteine desulfurase